MRSPRASQAIDGCVSRGGHPFRHWAVFVIFGAVAVLTACWETDPRVEFAIENKTDSLLCVYPNLEAGGPCLNAVKPQKKTKWGPECTPTSLELVQVPVSLTVESTGELIYHRQATCREWIDSGAKITIEQRGDQFIVTDSLPDPTASP